MPEFTTADGIVNEDSIYIDTCGRRSGSMTCREVYLAYQHDSLFKATALYGRGEAWVLAFDEGVIDLAAYPPDTTIIVNWTAIDTGYAALRSALGHLDTVLGSFSLRKDNPRDTSGFGSRIYRLFFNDTLRRDLGSVGRAFDTLPNVQGGSVYSFAVFSAVPHPAAATTPLSISHFDLNRVVVRSDRRSGMECDEDGVYSLSGARQTAARLVEVEATGDGSALLTFDISTLMSGHYFIVICKDALPVLITR